MEFLNTEVFVGSTGSPIYFFIALSSSTFSAIYLFTVNPLYPWIHWSFHFTTTVLFNPFFKGVTIKSLLINYMPLILSHLALQIYSSTFYFGLVSYIIGLLLSVGFSSENLLPIGVIFFVSLLLKLRYGICQYAKALIHLINFCYCLSILVMFYYGYVDNLSFPSNLILPDWFVNILDQLSGLWPSTSKLFVLN